MNFALENWMVIAGIVVGAIVAFWIIHKIVKAILAIVIVGLIAAAAIFYCVKAGYVSRETAGRLNPMNNETVRRAVNDAGTWAGNKAKDAVKKTLREAVDDREDAR